MVTGVLAMPILIKGPGIDRFGVLALMWMVIGDFSLFELGRGRASTRFVAEKLEAGQDETIPALVWTALFPMVILGAGEQHACVMDL
jgi:O-antigen/teichoic acid export membrane protein